MVNSTVDHSLLLTRLQRCFGVEGGCLEWFSSYLSGRSYCVVVDGVFLQGHLRHLLGATGLGFGASLFHPICGGSSRHRVV